MSVPASPHPETNVREDASSTSDEVLEIHAEHLPYDILEILGSHLVEGVLKSDAIVFSSLFDN